jgi:hypothetical protein
VRPIISKPALACFALTLGAATLFNGGPSRAQAVDDLASYFGNTFISLHDDGTQYIVYWNRDGTFRLLRRGGPEPGYALEGAYTLEGGRSCFHAQNAPPGAPGCVPIELGRTPGTVWEINGRVHELHMIVAGRRP